MDRLDDLVARLDLVEKVALVAGADLWHTPSVDRCAIPPIKMSDGPSGVRGAQWTGGPPSASFPCGAALGATWDVDLVERVGQALAEECRSKGAHVLLGPTVNLHRTPIGGRNFECLSEDPHLTARLAVAYVRGVQASGVAACVKHLVANDTEEQRFTASSDVSERALRELYLVPFEAAVREAGAWSVMAAYNRLNGRHCSEHPWLLTGLLRDEWGWDGVVVSDWWGTHSTVDAANAGLDIEMPGPPLYFGPKLQEAVERGEVDEKAVDEKVRRVLRLAGRTGALDADGPATPERHDDSPERRALLREAAAASIVLLRNEPVDGAPLLPLAPDALECVAVIGPNADAAHIQGGGSAQVSPPYAVTPFEGLVARLGPGVRVVHEPGGVVSRGTPPLDIRLVRAASGDPGLEIELVDTAERLLARRSQLRWSGGAATVTATLTPRRSGVHTFKLRAQCAARLSIDGSEIATGEEPGEIELEAGREYDLRLHATPVEGSPLVGVDIRCAEPVPDDLLDRALAAARDADAVVLVVGRDGEWETEGRDGDTLSLPGNQDLLVERVRAANPRTVVVVNAGSPVAMPWADRAPAIVQLWFPGQEGGNALADVLTGDASPSGRLPTTFPRRIQDTPAFLNYPPEAGRMVYGEGVFVGYRWYDARLIEPLFPFGHGMSYTTFSYGELSVDGNRVTVDVTNDGPVAGAEVVQLYVSDLDASVARPVKELKGFRRVHLEPGRTATVSFELDERAFAFWDADAQMWRAEPGQFDLLVGASSVDIRARATYTLSPS